MIDAKDLHKKWMRDPEYRDAYERLEPELQRLERKLEVAEALPKARAHAGLTRAELAERLGIAPAAIERFERGRALPSMKTLDRIARATGTRLWIGLELA